MVSFTFKTQIYFLNSIGSEVSLTWEMVWKSRSDLFSMQRKSSFLRNMLIEVKFFSTRRHGSDEGRFIFHPSMHWGLNVNVNDAIFGALTFTWLPYLIKRWGRVISPPLWIFSTQLSYLLHFSSSCNQPLYLLQKNINSGYNISSSLKDLGDQLSYILH